MADQAYDPLGGPSLEGPVSPLQQGAQTFTVGIDGVLAFVELWLYQQAPGGMLQLDVRPTAAGAPVEADVAALATVTIPDGTVSGVPGLFVFDLQGLGVAVTAGQTLAVTVRVVGGAGAYRWGRDDPGGYSGGSAYERAGTGGPWSQVAGADFVFRTYVTPGP